MSDVIMASEMLAEARRFRLYGVHFLEMFPVEQLARAFNGIGPECFPEIIRKAIDILHPDLLVVAFIHDCQWSLGKDVSWAAFDLSNDFFEINGRKVADAKYKWFDPRRYIRRHQARVFADLCRDFGWRAFIAAKKGQAK